MILDVSEPVSVFLGSLQNKTIKWQPNRINMRFQKNCDMAPKEFVVIERKRKSRQT